MLRRVYKFLASLQLAVLLLVALGGILATATYYESRYDAKTAAHLVYGSGWFYFFLFMLGVNVTCAAAIRYPWKRHQTGFVVTHLGIIVLLMGSFVTAVGGLEGTMALSDGERSHTVTVDRPELSYQISEVGQAKTETPAPDSIVTMPLELRWSPPTEANPRRIPLKNGLTLVIDRYYNHALPDLAYSADGAADNPAVRFSIKNQRVNLEEWLALADPDHREMQAGPGKVRMLAAPTQSDLDRALADDAQATSSQAGYLMFNLGKGKPAIAVESNVGKVVEIPGTSYKLRIDRFLPHAGVKNKKLTNRSPRMVNPAVEFTILDDQGEAEQHLLFARFPDLNTVHGTRRKTSLQVEYSLEPPRQQAGLDIVVGPENKLYYKLHSSRGAGHSGAVEIGKPTATGWMDLAFTVEAFYPRARVEHVYREITAAKLKDSAPPALRCRVEGADAPGPYWLGQGEDIEVTKGKQLTHLYYHLHTEDIGFAIELQHFQVGYDPGTRTAASYSSDVEVQDAPDPARHHKGATYKYHICMNDPLHHAGLTFFQASFQEGEGRPTVSILQVAKDPGITLKYAGSILLVCGIAMMFFMKGAFKAGPRNKNRSDVSKGMPADPLGSS